MAKLEVKENVVFAEIKESVSPYAEMMELLKEYIDQVDSITYCDSLPGTGETDHLYIVRTGEAYIYEGEWIELTGGGTTGITGINVNGEAQEVINHVVNLLIPTELSDLDNDMGYITSDALDGYALEDEIPTKVSELENDSGYTTAEAVAEQIAEIVAGAPESLDTLKEIADWIEHHEDSAAEMNTAIKEAQETADSALTAAEDAKDSIPTKVSELDNDAGYAAQSDVEAVKTTADSKVSSVNVGTVTTGDEPSVTNSGTAKDVVMDFVFPQSGVLTGTAEAGDVLKFAGSMVHGILFSLDKYAFDEFICAKGEVLFISIDFDAGVSFVSDHYEMTSDYDIDYVLVGATLVE